MTRITPERLAEIREGTADALCSGDIFDKRRDVAVDLAALLAEIDALQRIEAAARALVEAVDASGCQRGHSIRVLAEALGMGEPSGNPGEFTPRQ